MHGSTVLQFDVEIFLRGVGEFADRFLSFFGEEGDEDGEADENGELEEDLTPVPEEDFPASREEGAELADGAGVPDGVGSEVGVVDFVTAFGSVEGRDAEFAFFNEFLAVGAELVVVGLAMFGPGGLPFLAGLFGEFGVDLFAVVNGEVVGELGR